MPLRYIQYEYVLPQPPPSVPSVPSSHTTQQPEFSPPTGSTDMSARARMSFRAPLFRTAMNVFGLVHQFFSSTPPSHDPEEAVTLQDISSIPTVTPANNFAESHDISFHPCPNRTSFELRDWYWNGNVQKSHQGFKELID